MNDISKRIYDTMQARKYSYGELAFVFALAAVTLAWYFARKASKK